MKLDFLVNSGSKKRTPKITDIMVHMPNKCSHQTSEFTYAMPQYIKLDFSF
jgi:hypothetical protein